MKKSEEKQVLGRKNKDESMEQKRKEVYESPKLMRHDPLDSVTTTVYYYYWH